MGAIFTKAKKDGDVQGTIDGTLSFDAVHWNDKDRDGDSLADINWNDSINANGYKGSSFARGVAGHGSLSPYEVHIALLASGPSFKGAYKSELPTSNVDIVPTILHIHQLAVPASMDGRVLHELLVEKSSQPALLPKHEEVKTSVMYPRGRYVFVLDRRLMGKYKYVNFSKVVRNTK